MSDVACHPGFSTPFQSEAGPALRQRANLKPRLRSFPRAAVASVDALALLGQVLYSSNGQSRFVQSH